MNEIESLVKNFISIARERLLILFLFFVLAIAFDLVPESLLLVLLVNVMLHAGQMYLVNKSFQSHFTRTPRFGQILEILDAIALGLFFISLLIILIFAVFL
jgi:hypothetical protein